MGRERQADPADVAFNRRWQSTAYASLTLVSSLPCVSTARETSSLKVFSPPPDIEIYGPDKHVKVTYDT
jgi:hypothetical protein